ncbi:uncharacterized protein LOC133415092 [Phycodurus eques]|uniref:uncharacterized protein LOC133415092 n=1 Tax=Phycodurus eques TaxID=693459 RepID=UPI002ACE5F05|nr:uncharacterized protein LOC133415092 [Phycodurus eques]
MHRQGALSGARAASPQCRFPLRRMTKPKTRITCPLCQKKLDFVAKHLRERHKLKNKDERRILNKLALNRIKLSGGKCPVVECRKTVIDLQCHVYNHVNVDPHRLQSLIQQLKVNEAIKQLAHLRSSSPLPPMVSQLDLNAQYEAAEEEKEEQEEVDIPSSGCLDCAAHLATIRSLEKQVSELKAGMKFELLESRINVHPSGRSVAWESECPIKGEREDPDDEEFQGEAGSCKEAHCEEGPCEEAKSDKSQGEEFEYENEYWEEEPHDDWGATDPGRPRDSSDDEGLPNETAKQRLRRKVKKLFGRKNSRRQAMKLQFPVSIAAYIEEYLKHIFPQNGSRKMKDNAVTRLSRVMFFLSYMIEGWQSENMWDWLFLDNGPHLQEFPKLLHARDLKISTRIKFMRQVQQFIKYLRKHRPIYIRLKRDRLSLVHEQIKKLMQEISRPVVKHRIMVKWYKSANQVRMMDLLACRQLSAAKIPVLLEKMEKQNTENSNLRFQFFGYLAAYLTALYGHRSGDLINMTVTEVDNAKGSPEEGYLINVVQHKTLRSHGNAQIFLNAKEFSWFERWGQLRRKANPPNNYFLANNGSGIFTGLVRNFRAAWKDMGLSFKPNLTDLRISLAIWNFENNPEAVQKQISSSGRREGLRGNK